MHTGDSARLNQVFDRPVELFQRVYELAHDAARAAGGFVDHSYQIGGHSVRLRFAGLALVPRTVRALAHLATPPVSQPELTVCLWDSRSTGVNGVPLAWGSATPLFRGEVPPYNDGRFHAAHQSWAGVFSMLDNEQGRAVFWIEDASRLHFSMCGAPLRDILHWWLGHRGVYLVHGAGVGTSAGGVLLTGRGSSGKSSTALACVHSGLLYAGDDHVLVSAEPSPFLHSVYNTAQLDVGGALTFSDLIPSLPETPPTKDPKAQLFLYEHLPSRIAPGFPLRAILLPRVTGSHDTSVRKASPREALLALAPATIYALPEAGQNLLHNLAALIRQLPSYVLSLGTDLAQIPPLVSSLLSAA